MYILNVGRIRQIETVVLALNIHEFIGIFFLQNIVFTMLISYFLCLVYLEVIFSDSKTARRELVETSFSESLSFPLFDITHC